MISVEQQFKESLLQLPFTDDHHFSSSLDEIIKKVTEVSVLTYPNYAKIGINSTDVHLSFLLIPLVHPSKVLVHKSKLSFTPVGSETSNWLW